MAGAVSPDEIEAALGYRFANRALLVEALTHAIALGTGAVLSLERLEFLGDRVLALCLAVMLMERFPDEAPGALARRHAALASRQTLVRVGREIGLSRHIRTQPDLGRRRGALPPSMIEDACEALIGAVYRDGGHDAAREVIERLWGKLTDGAPPSDAKTALQEWVQARGRPLPVYRTVAREGPPHDPVFTIEVAVEGLPPARASAGSKRAAERAAARELLAIADAEAGQRG